MTDSYFVHPTACVEDGAQVGDGTKIWHFAHVRTGARLGSDCIISKSSFIDFGVKLGNRVKIQNMVSVYHGVTLEDDVFVGPHAVFTNDLRPRASPGDGWQVSETLVKEGASIGANATILCGIQLGRHCLIGMASAVTRSVPDHGLVFGNPGKLRGWVCECTKKLPVPLHRDKETVVKCECGKSATLPAYPKPDST